MAAVIDIDTKAAVRKFLERRSVVNREDQAADRTDETTAVLEAIALSFLLYPQAALSFILQAKNVLQQITSTDRDIIDYLLIAINDIDNPDEAITDTSDLIEAQSALVEVDRIGRVSDDVLAYDRYTKSIARFLDRRLAKALKRRRSGEFERTGNEARQDIFQVLSVLGPTHDLMITRLGQLLSGVDNFRSVSLTKIVSTRAVTRVRSSLNQVIQRVQKQQLSKTAIAIELLSGAAALSSVSNSRDIYDPTVDTDSFPTGRSIKVFSERTPAIAKGISGSVSLSALSAPWIFGLTVDGNGFSVTIPVSGASGRSYVKASTGAQLFNIPIGSNVLYVQFDGITPPTNEAAMVRAVSIPTGGSVGISAILAALNNVSTGLINGTATELGTTGRIVLYGSSSVTKITINSVGRGTFDLSGNFVPAIGSVHNILGFIDGNTSGNPNNFTSAEIMDLLEPYVPLANFSVSNIEEPIIETASTELSSSLTFSGTVAQAFGFIGTHIPDPKYLELIENGRAIDPTTIGVFIGSVLSASDSQSISSKNILAPITAFEGTHILFAEEVLLPRVNEGQVRVLSPLVFSVQSLLDNVSLFKNSFDQDSRETQRILAPLLSKPTLAQTNDAKRVLQLIRNKVDNLLTQLTNTVVRSDRSEFDSVAKQISSSLEERGLDRALELLQSCQFSDFFSLTSDGASKGNRFLKATEQVGRNEFSQIPSEQDQNDTEPLGTTPDENLLTGEELLEDEEQL